MCFPSLKGSGRNEEYIFLQGRYIPAVKIRLVISASGALPKSALLSEMGCAEAACMAERV